MKAIDHLIAEMNARLTPDNGNPDESPCPRLPVVFLMGVPRSGTTPLAQLLIQQSALGYVTNLVAKFWEAPEYGIALARSLSADPGGTVQPIISRHGGTEDYEGHHEFGYFWKKWFRFGESHHVDPASWTHARRKGLLAALARMEAAWSRPLFFKNAAALPLQTSMLGNMVDSSLFIYVSRDPYEVAHSLYQARMDRFGTDQGWFSIRPRGASALEGKTTAAQVAGQVYETKTELERQLDSLPAGRVFRIDYAAACRDTVSVMSQLRNWLAAKLPGLRFRPERFEQRLNTPQPLDRSEPFMVEFHREWEKRARCAL